MTLNGSLRGFLTGLMLMGGLTILPLQASTIGVSDISTDTFNLFDASTGALIQSTPIPLAGIPSGVTLGPDGFFYVADQQNNFIDRFNPITGAFVSEFVIPGVGPSALNQPTGITFGPNGNLYVDNFGNGGNSFINEYDGPSSGTPGAFVEQFVAPGAGPVGGLFDPEGLVFQNGNLFVADSSNGEIAEFNGTTAAYTAFVPLGSPSGLANPQDVAFDASGNLYVTDLTFGGIIYKYGPTGNFIGTFVPSTSPDLTEPIGLAFGPDGNLYVANSGNGEVAEFNGQTGAPINGTFTPVGDLINAQFLAFSATPEPSTFAFVVLGGIGFAWLRRRRFPV
jgi:streptogramin lyase